MPDFVEFQHARIVDAPPNGPEWLHELKLDGYRMQLRVEGGSCRWRTRHALDWTDRLPDLSSEAAALPDCILDGEVCALTPDGVPNFSALRSAMGRRQGGAIVGELVFFAFDVLFDPDDVRVWPLEARKARLQEILEPGGEPVSSRLRALGEVPGSGAELIQAACRAELEGIVSKRLGSPYEGGDNRPGTWVKAKCRPSQEVVIGGWHARNGVFRSLLAGLYEGDALRYVGGVRSGFGGRVLEELMPKLKALEIPKSPFVGEQPKKEFDIHWTRPELVAAIEISEWTASGKLRQASFKGLREDKPAREVVREQPAREGPDEPGPRKRARTGASAPKPQVDNPGKVLWPATEDTPAVTKADLARYYEEVAPWLLPYIEGRPCTVVIAPDGIGGEVTYARHEGHWRGLLRTSPLITHTTVAEKGKTYPQFDTREALVVAADIAVVELHPWNSEPGRPMLPERIVIDLDPEPGQTWAQVIGAAEEIRERLADAGLTAWLKTSGGRGVHVVAPFAQDPDRPTSWAEAKAFGERLCRRMAADSPERYTVALTKAQRGERIFLDYLRNDPGHHAVALLSPRARPGAPVSMPVSWRSAAKLHPRQFTIRNAVERLRKSDPWRDYGRSKRSLPPASSLP